MICGTAPCGVRYAAARSGQAAAWCALTIGCGTRDEEGFPGGIAHFTEHSIFKGTKRRRASSVNNCLDRLGGELNAYTTKEEIVIHATVLREDLRKAASLLLELATEATFPENEILTEKGVVIEEIQSYKDSPADDVYDRFEELLLEGHPLSRPILGKAASVRRISREDLLRFTGEKFRPEVMALTLVADLPEQKMEQLALSLIDKFFSGRAEPRGRRAPLALPSRERFDLSIGKRNHEANVVIGGMGPSLYDEKERYVAVLLANLLAGPASNSLLGNILREKHGWVYAVESSLTQYSECGVFAISLGCDKANLEKCFAAVDKELLRLCEQPLSPRRLAAAKKQLLGQLIISSEGGESRCLSMGKSLISFGRISPDGEVRSKIEDISPEDLLACCRRILDPSNLSRLIYL